MSFDPTTIAKQVADIDAALKPIAGRTVDVNDPNWIEKLRSSPHPLDQAGVRAEAQALMAQMLAFYASGDAMERAGIREILAKYRSFAWATGSPESPTTESGFRQHLLRLSAENGGGDMRDTIMAVNALCQSAVKAGLDVGPALREVTELSSASIVHIKSMRSVLLEAQAEYAAGAC